MKTINKNKIPKLRFPGFFGELDSAKATTGNWEDKRLGEVANFWNGKAHEQEISENGKYIVINSKFISQNGDVRKYSDKQISPLKKNDVVIVMSDIPNGKAIGKCFLIDQDNKYTLNQRIGGIKSKEIIGPFLFRILNRNKYFLKFDNGVSQTNLRKDEILRCPVVFPSLPEQQKIAEFLGVVDEWIGNLRAQKESLEKYKKGMMQKIFSQEIRFKDENGNNFSEWEEKRLGEVGDIITGATPSTSNAEYYSGNFPWITPTDINNQKDIYGSARFLTKKGLEKGRFIPKNSLLVTCIASIGKNAILRVNGSCNQQINAIIPNKKNNVEFLYYLVEKNKNIFIRFAGAGGMQILNKADFSGVKFKIPLLPEQEKIAEFLTSIDNLIESKQQQITQAEQWKKGLMQRLFV